MKICLVGDSVEYGLPSSYKRSFESLGHRVLLIDSEKLYRQNVFASNRYFHRLFWRVLALPLQKRLIRKVVGENPDMVLVVKGWLIKPATLRKIKNKLLKTKVFNFNPDNPFNTWQHGSSNSWIRKSIPLYDCYFIWGKFLIEPLKKAGAKRVEYLPFGYDPMLHYPVEVSEEERKIYGSDIAFIGSWDEEREKWLNGLLDYDLKIWGNHWQKANKKLQEKWQRKEIVGEEFSKVCASAKIILNFIRRQNASAHNMRTFEVPACKGFMLSTRTPEQEEFFKEGVEADYFSTPEELKEKIDFYLRNEELRKRIAEASYQRLINSDSSYKDRAKQVLEIYKSI